MSFWNPAASDRLAKVVAQLRHDGVVDMMHEIIGHVWDGNVDRFEPSIMGDTNKSIGGTAAENILTLTLRTMINAAQWELSDSVRVGAPAGSLQVVAGVMKLHVVKAPAMKLLRLPDFDGFRWTADSETRAAAANDNALKFNPFAAGRGGMFDNLVPPIGSADALRHVFLIWAGGSDAPNTAGWLGFPTSTEGPWLAIEPLWWDKTGTGPSRRLTGPVEPLRDAPSFVEAAVPQPKVALKRRKKTAGQ